MNPLLALTLILQGPDEQPGARFTERILETAIGVALALLFGALIPALLLAAQRRRRHDPT